MPSLMDVLAERLSERTGTTFRVVRVHDTGLRRQVVSYVVHVERSGHSMPFPQASANETKRTLAMLSDLVNMGFLRLLPLTPVFAVGDIVTWGTGQYACRVLKDDASALVLENHTGTAETWSYPRRPAGLRACPEGSRVGPIVQEIPK